MKKSLKIKFVDMYDGFTPQTSRLAKIIEENFGYELSDNPDYLIAGPYSHEHLKYDCVKIFAGPNRRHVKPISLTMPFGSSDCNQLHSPCDQSWFEN